MTRPLTVVRIDSISFTGTTWLNTVLGSMPGAFALGPPDRAWQLREEGFEKACLVHGQDCAFWRGLAASYDPAERFLPQLAAAADARFIVVNNPSPDFEAAELRHPDILEKPIRMIRDGRAVAASFARKFPDHSFVDAVLGWLMVPYRGFPFDERDEDLLCLRYEDVERDPHAALDRCGRYLGVEIPASALRFWEHPHHVTSGNQGLIAHLRLGQGLDIASFAGHEFYREQFEQLRSDPTARFTDERWLSEVSPIERFVFDLACGTAHARFGYERDRFTVEETRGHLEAIRAAIAAGEAPAGLEALVREEEADRTTSSLGTPGEDAEASASPVHGLREQLSLQHLRFHGLHATPSQTKRLLQGAAMTAGGLVAIGLVIGLLGGLLL